MCGVDAEVVFHIVPVAEEAELLLVFRHPYQKSKKRIPLTSTTITALLK